MDNRRVTISLALIVLVCFFLPWVQLSCGTSTDRLNGIDLARDGHNSLWLIPLLMVPVLLLAVLRAWRDRAEISSWVSLIAGLVSTYLMNRERMRFKDTSGLIAVELTVWFWLGFGSSVALVGLAAFRFLVRHHRS